MKQETKQVVTHTTTTTITLDEDGVKEILLRHFGLGGKVNVDFDCGLDVLREVRITVTSVKEEQL